MFRRLFWVCVIVIALAGGVWLRIPQRLASAWFLNTANVSLARAHTFPSSSPERARAALDASRSLSQAENGNELPRLALARARSWLARGDASRALETFAAAPLPPDSISEFLWAQAAWQAQQPEVAFAHWGRAGAITYFMQEAHRAIDMHRWREAEQLARIAVGIDPALADAHYVLAAALAVLSPDHPETLSELDAALERTHDPEFISTILSQKGEVLAALGNLPDALEQFDRARGVAPIDARPRTDYAVTWLRLHPNEPAPSLALLQQVVQDSPWYVAAYIALADMAESGGDPAGAEAWLQLGLARNPNDARLLLPLGKLRIRNGRPEQAREILSLALKYETHADDQQEIMRQLAELDRR